MLLIIELLVIAGLMLYVQLRPMVVENVVLEVGNRIPDVKDFLLYKRRKASFITDINDIDVNKPGDYDIQIKTGLRVQSSKLQIVDTVPPQATVVNLTVLKGDEVEAEEFITDLTDATDVTITYQEAPDTTIPGEREVTIILVDRGGNITIKEALLTVLDIKSSITVEAGSNKLITIDDFINDSGMDISFITDVASINTATAGIHELLLDVDGREVTGYIHVVDTTPPKAVVKKLEIWKGDQLPDAMNFVSSIEDASEVLVEYKTIPDVSQVGVQEVELILKDGYGNASEFKTSLTVKEDKEAPRIIGTRNKTVYIGESVAYKKGVSVIDNRDTDLQVKVDSSKVNLKKEGVYDVVYTAVDSAGNKTVVTTTVTVIKFVVTQAMLDEEADKILAKITTPDMTKLKKAEVIYYWIKKNVAYVGDSDKSDWKAEAYRAIKDKKGDCFTYFAIAHALLTRAGIDSIQVTRLGGKTKHFWNLVNCGDGWYHFDSCPNKDHVETFMLTDKELDAFAKTRGDYYYNRDKSLYPATPDK
jgi:hypothetical protein